MMFRTHILFAIFFYLLFIKIFALEFSLIFSLVLALGAIMPDIDSPKSYINRKYLFGIGKGIAAFSKHRGFWHSVYGLGIFLVLSVSIVILTGVPFIFCLALPLGYFLHLLADSFNVSGIKWLWKSKKMHLRWKIKTGHISEQLFFIILFLFTVYLVIGNYGVQDIIGFVSKIVDTTG